LLKTREGSNTWLVDQPAHGALSGLLAAHWGNQDFTVPGYYPLALDLPFDPEEVRREVVLAISEHDNGWWEWEAAPPLASDGLPAGLEETLAKPQEGMSRWQMGIARLAEHHPYASWLISEHALRLYAAQFEEHTPSAFIHPIDPGKRTYPDPVHQSASQFLAELRATQRMLEKRIAQQPYGQAALDPALSHPHARLLQILDALSLALCSATLVSPGLGRGPLRLTQVPRRSGLDLVDLQVTPLEPGTLCLHPYPFDKAPLQVAVPARCVPPQTWWRQVPPTLLQFILIPGA